MKWKLYWATAVTVLAVSLYGMNSHWYPHKSRVWRAGKSAIESGVITLLAWVFPPLLIGWTVYWLTKPVERPAYKITLAVVVGALLGPAAATFLELIIIGAVLSIDNISREFLKHWRELGEVA